MIITLSNISSILDAQSTSPEKRDALNVLHWEKLVGQLLGLPATNL